MAPLFRENCKVMYIDSFFYYIECDNVYDIMKRDSTDSSDYAIDNVYVIVLR